MSMKRTALLGGLVALSLGACSSYHSHVKADGTSDQLSWPDPARVTFNGKQGTFPDLDSLALVKPGMTKDQLYYLLGRPHFNEGMVNVREWTYLFHFHTPNQGSNGVTTCQFKVLYDKDVLTRNFYWKAVDPTTGSCPPNGAPAAKSARYTLGADALFAFDKSGVNDLNAEGRAQLNDLAQKLKQFDRLHSVRVIGHTDYLGSESYNQNLSQARAQTVRSYLASQGIDAGIIRASGMGERQPVKQCQQTAKRADLIACLKPNRRVVVEVDGSGTVQ